MNRIYLLYMVAFGYCILPLQAQTINVSFEKGAKGEYIFYADNQFSIPYTLEVTFSKLANASGNITAGIPYETTVMTGKQRIFTLNRMNPNTPIDFQFTRTFLKGDTRMKADTGFVYLLPVTEGKKVRIGKVNSPEKLLGQKKESHVTGLSFYMEEGDTVYASRSGIVTAIQENSASAGGNIVYSAKENYVEIYHKDSSFAIYRLFRNNGIFVSPGEKVIAGQPIGIIGKGNNHSGSRLHFRSYYLFKNKDTRSANVQKKTKAVIFTPQFHLAPANDGKPVFNKLYTVEHPVKYITEEMTRLEKKNFLSRQLNGK